LTQLINIRAFLSSLSPLFPAVKGRQGTSKEIALHAVGEIQIPMLCYKRRHCLSDGNEKKKITTKKQAGFDQYD
jgi:hypothetical protein